MKWQRKESVNFEDRRGMSGGGKALLGGGLIGVVVLLLNMFGGETGQTIGNIIEQTQGTESQTEGEKPENYPLQKKN